MTQLIIPELHTRESELWALRSRVKTLKEQLDLQGQIVRSLRDELNAITAAGRCCLCGSPKGEPASSEEEGDGESPRSKRLKSQIGRAARAAAERAAIEAIDRLTVPELVALIARTFNDREDLRARCETALRDGGRKALVFFRPYLIKALAEPPATKEGERDVERTA